MLSDYRSPIVKFGIVNVDCDRSKVVSNRKQLERLVNLMQQNEDIAKGFCTKTQAKRRWEAFAQDLNSLGPPVREWDKWLKVWTDMKFKIKKKKIENKAELNATGGGPNRLHTFSNMEEAVISLLQIDTSVDPPGQEFGLSQTDEYENCDLDKENEVSLIQQNKNREEKRLKNTKEKVRANKSEKNDIRIEMLQKQTQCQQEFYEAVQNLMRDIKISLKNLEEYTKKMYYFKKDMKKELLSIKKEKLAMYKEEVKSKAKDRATKLRVKMQLLEMQKYQMS